MSDPKAVGLQLVAVVRDFLGRAVAPIVEAQRELAAGLRALRERELPELVQHELAARIKELPAPKDGVSPDPAAIAVIVREGLAPEIVALSERADHLEEQLPEMLVAAAEKALESLPKPKDGQTPSEEALAALVSKAVDAIPRPKDGVSPEPLEAEALRPLVEAEVERAVKALPAPQPGRDADNEAIARIVLAGVAELRKELPQPELDVDALRPALEELVAKAIEALPAAQPGKDADSAEITRLVLLGVEQLSKALPAPQLDLEAIRPMIAEQIKSAVLEAIPEPIAGKDADNAAIAELVLQGVEKIAKALPIPEKGDAGTSVSLDDVRPLIAEEAERAAAALPKAEPGKSVPIEDVQRMVDEAVRKAVGALQIKNGEPGRDALELRPIPAIDVEKSYPRDVYAFHAGGIWRSFEATQGMKGWEVAVNGIAGLAFEDDEDGRPVMIVRQTNGELVRQAIPSVGYKDVWRPGQTYAKGDFVTFGGSMFHSNVNGNAEKPETGAAWTLAAKRGRDGADLRPPAEPGEPPQVRLR